MIVFFTESTEGFGVSLQTKKRVRKRDRRKIIFPITLEDRYVPQLEGKLKCIKENYEKSSADGGIK